MDLTPGTANVTLSTVTQSVSSGNVIQFTLKIENSGMQELTGITLTHLLPTSAMYIKDSASYIFPPGSPEQLLARCGTNIILDLPITIEIGQTVYVTYLARFSDEINAGDEFSNQVILTSNEIPLGQASNEVILIASFARIAACKRILSGGNNSTLYVIELTNTGNISAENVVVTDELPCSCNVYSVCVANRRLVCEEDYFITRENYITIRLPIAIYPGENIRITVVCK